MKTAIECFPAILGSMTFHDLQEYTGVLAFGTALILGMVVGESVKKGYQGEGYNNYY